MCDAQERRLALGCCVHTRLGGSTPLIVDTDVISLIGQGVVAQCLMSRADAAQQLAAAQDARMLCGKTILLGTAVRFEHYGDGVYVGCGDARDDPCAGRPMRGTISGYSFCFGDGAEATVYPALMEPTEWTVLPLDASAVQAVLDRVADAKRRKR